MTARRFSSLLLLIVVALSAALPAWAQTGVATSGVYYPGAEWLHKTPAELGISAARLKDAIDFAISAETKAPRDLKLNHYQTFGREPFGYAIGPIKDRGEPTGIAVAYMSPAVAGMHDVLMRALKSHQASGGGA